MTKPEETPVKQSVKISDSELIQFPDCSDIFFYGLEIFRIDEQGITQIPVSKYFTTE